MPHAYVPPPPPINTHIKLSSAFVGAVRAAPEITISQFTNRVRAVAVRSDSATHRARLCVACLLACLPVCSLMAKSKKATKNKECSAHTTGITVNEAIRNRIQSTCESSSNGCATPMCLRWTREWCALHCRGEPRERCDAGESPGERRGRERNSVAALSLTALLCAIRLSQPLSLPLSVHVHHIHLPYSHRIQPLCSACPVCLLEIMARNRLLPIRCDYTSR